MAHLSITSNDLGPLFLVIAPVCLAWIIVAVSLRVATKIFVVRKLTTDDLLTLVCLGLSVGQTMAICIAAQYGLGRHEDSISSAHLSVAQKSFYTAELLYIPNLVCAKLGVLSTLSSLTPAKRERWIIFVVQGLVATWGITSEFATAFQCGATQPWNWSRSSCIDRKALAEYVAAVNLVTEVALILVPCVIIGRIQQKLAQKLKTLASFVLRILAVAAIATQIAYLTDTPSSDLAYNLWRDIICMQAVQCVVVICTCFVYLRPYLEWLESGFLRVDDLRRKLQSGYASKNRSYSTQSTNRPVEHSQYNQSSSRNLSKVSASDLSQQRESNERVSSRQGRSDGIVLMRMGKNPLLKRTFGFMPSLGFSCSILVTWEGVNTLFIQGLQNGGPAGLVYGYLFIWLGNISVFMTLSELVSMAPISSGQYHWVSMLAPFGWHTFLSYLTGWFTIVGWQALVASASYLAGTIIQGLIVLTVPSYNFHAWHGTLLFWAVVVFAVFVNTVISSALPKFEGLIFILHVAGFFAILIPLVVLGPHDSANDVFTTFMNGGNWPTQSLSFFVGLLGNVFAFFGADGAIHMSEEIRNAPVIVPRSMLSAIAINGTLGFAMLLGLLFCMGDSQAALNSPTGYPYIEIYYQAVQSTSGAAIMASFVATMTICAAVAALASASRLLWAFARDRAIPGWRFLQRLDSRTSIPVIAVAVTMIVSFLLALIIIGSSTVFNDIVGLSVSGIYSSYLIVSVLLLWRRCRGDIQISSEDPQQVLTNLPGKDLIWGPWKLPGFLGILNNAFTCCFLFIVWFFSFWPPTTPATASTMNYNVLIIGAVAIFSVLYYWVSARKTYDGPYIETDGA